MVEPSHVGQLAIGIDGEFDGAAFEFVELIDERGGVGIVGVGFGGGAGFFVGGAQADRAAAGAVRGPGSTARTSMRSCMRRVCFSCDAPSELTMGVVVLLVVVVRVVIW